MRRRKRRGAKQSRSLLLGQGQPEQPMAHIGPGHMTGAMAGVQEPVMSDPCRQTFKSGPSGRTTHYLILHSVSTPSLNRILRWENQWYCTKICTPYAKLLVPQRQTHRHYLIYQWLNTRPDAGAGVSGYQCMNEGEGNARIEHQARTKPDLLVT